MMGVLSVGFGLCWTFLVFGMGAAGGFGVFFPLVGVLFIAVGVGMSVYQFRKARRYQAAYADYLRRRNVAQDRPRK